MNLKERLALRTSSERIVAFLVREHSYLILPISDINNCIFEKGGAPRLYGKATAIIAPDLLALRRGDGGACAFEVKEKESANYTRTTGYDEHGIARRLYDNYQEFYRKTGIPVVLCFVERSTGEIRARRLDHLRPRFSNGPDPGGSVFFRRRDLWLFYQGNPTDAPLFLVTKTQMPPTAPPFWQP